MVLYEEVKAHGHPNIRALHKTTFEITREEELSERGDCIIGVGADKGVSDLNPSFLEKLRRNDSILVIVLEANGVREHVLAHGSARLLLNSFDKIIVRKSDHIDGSTLAVRANKAAADLDRGLVSVLRKPSTVLYMRLYLITLYELEALAGKQSLDVY